MTAFKIRRIGAGVALGWLLAAGSGAGCGIAQADGGGVGAYLVDLDDVGLGSGSSTPWVNAGDGVCAMMRPGQGFNAALAVLERDGLAPNEATALGLIAMRDLCPDAWRMDTPPPGGPPPPAGQQTERAGA